MIRAGVIGQPIKHSRSPLIHGHWLKTLGIIGSYERIEVPPELLGQFLKDLQANGYAGCNITLPHKENATRYVDVIDDTAAAAGSINTVYLRDGKLHATSTDGYGFVANLKWRCPQLDFRNQRIVLLGAGGSARAIVASLLREGVGGIWLANRTVSRAVDIARLFGDRVSAISFSELPTILPTCDLLINTTSAGIVDAERLSLPWQLLPPQALVTDINYVPRVTPFLREAMTAGHRTIDGLGMLLHQAVPGFELWFGRRPTVTQEIYDLVARDIEAEPAQ